MLDGDFCDYCCCFGTFSTLNTTFSRFSRISNREFDMNLFKRQRSFEGCTTLWIHTSVRSFQWIHRNIYNGSTIQKCEWKHFFAWNDSRIMIFIRRSSLSPSIDVLRQNLLNFYSLCVTIVIRRIHKVRRVSDRASEREKVRKWTGHELHIFAFAILCVISNVRIWHLWYT